MATAGSEPAGSDPDRRIIAGVPPPLRRPALRQRAALTLLLAVCAASSACSPGFRTVTISDPAAPSVITIAAAAGPQAHVTALRIRAAGSVDGNGTHRTHARWQTLSKRPAQRCGVVRMGVRLVCVRRRNPLPAGPRAERCAQPAIPLRNTLSPNPPSPASPRRTPDPARPTRKLSDSPEPPHRNPATARWPRTRRPCRSSAPA